MNYRFVITIPLFIVIAIVAAVFLRGCVPCLVSRGCNNRSRIEPDLIPAEKKVA